MEQPKVEFFTEDVDGVEYLNVGFVFYVPGSDEPIRAVLGAFQGEVAEEARVIIVALVEEATIYMQGVYSGEIVIADVAEKLEVVTPKLTIVGE